MNRYFPLFISILIVGCLVGCANTEKAKALYDEAYGYKVKGDYEIAIVTFNKAIENDPRHEKAYYELGLIHHELADKYEKNGQFTQSKGSITHAINNYKKTISINPNHVDALYNLGLLSLKQGNTDQAKNYFDKAKSLNPALGSIIEDAYNQHAASTENPPNTPGNSAKK